MSKALRAFSYALLRAFGRSVRFPRTTLLVVALVAIALGTGLPKIRLILSIHDLIESNLKSLSQLNQLNKDFKEGRSSLVFFVPQDGQQKFSSIELCRIRSWIQRQPAEDHEIIDVISPFQIRRAHYEDHRLWYPQVISDRCDPRELQILQSSPWEGLLFDPVSGAISAEIVFQDSRARTGNFDPSPVKRLIERSEREFQGSSIRTLQYGNAPFLYYALQGLKFTRIINLIAIFALLLIFRVLFGTFKSGFLFVGTLIFSAICLYGIMGWTGAPIDILSNGLFLLIAISTLEDFVFVSYLQMTEGGNWRRHFRQILIASFFTSLTTAIGFGSLVSSDLHVIQRFGALAAAGAMIEWFVLSIVFPALLRLVPSLRTWTRPDRARLKTLTKQAAMIRLGRRFRWVAAALFVAGIALSPWLNFQDDVARAFPPWHPLMKDQKEITSRVGWTTTMSLVFDPATSTEQKRAILEKVRAHPQVKKVEDPYTVESWMSGGLPASVQEVVKREFSISSFSRKYFATDGQVRANLYLPFSDVRSVKRLIDDLSPLCENETFCHFAGEVPSYSEFGDRVPMTLISSLSVSLLLVLGVLWFLCRATGTRPILPILYTSIWGPIVSLALLAATRFNVNFLTSIYASALVGLAGDNAIQYLFAGYRKTLAQGVARFGGGSVQIALSMSITALVFLFSKFLQAKFLGALLSLGLMICLAGDLWLLSALIGDGSEKKPRS